jgi:trk system potassium uptake protein TrkA
LARPKNQISNNVVVVGLGRFGGAVAQSLTRLGHEVLAIEESLSLVQSWSDRLTHVVQADSSNIEALRQLGVADFQHAVVGIGSDIEASVLTVLALSELGVPDIWAKAVTTNHGKILEKTGAHHVVYPEVAMGERVAHLVTGKMIDFIEFDDDFAIVKTRPPREAVGKTLEESQLRARHGVTVIGVKRPREEFTYSKPSTLVVEGDLLIVSGPTQKVERFAALP